MKFFWFLVLQQYNMLATVLESQGDGVSTINGFSVAFLLR